MPDDTEDELSRDEIVQTESDFGPNAWDRLPNEPEKWFFRFKRYLRAGPSRSFLSIFNAERAEKGGKKALRISGAWDKRIKQFDWENRARAYDQHLEQQEQAEFERQRKEFRQRELKLAQNLISKAEQMLRFPVAITKQEQQTEGGKTIVQTTILPAKWNFRDAAQIIEAADKLTRLALELDTERTAIDASVGAPEDIEAIRQKRWEQVVPQLTQALTELNSNEQQVEDEEHDETGDDTRV